MLRKLHNALTGTVSANKKRTKDDGGVYLDLSYITPRIIGMAAPGNARAADHRAGGSLLARTWDAIDGAFRNKAADVVRFLETRHGEHFKVYNLCAEEERHYDPALFGGRVAHFPFEDHHVPPLEVLTAFAQSAKAWLDQNENHVVVVHCKAGKSRTGLMVCTLLVHSGVAANADEAEALYNAKRTVDGRGLTLPSQRRYLRYFASGRAQEGAPPPLGVRAVLLYGPAARLAANLGPAHFRVRVRRDARTCASEGSPRWEVVGNSDGLRIPLSPPAVVAGDFEVELGAPHRPFWTTLHTAHVPVDGRAIVLAGADLDYFAKSLMAAAMAEEAAEAVTERCCVALECGALPAA